MVIPCVGSDGAAGGLNCCWMRLGSAVEGSDGTVCAKALISPSAAQLVNNASPKNKFGLLTASSFVCLQV